MSARRLAVVATGALVATLATALPASAAQGQILNENSIDSIKDSYIVVLKDAPRAVSAGVGDLTARYGGTVKYTYSSAVRGYSATMSATQAREVAADPAVAYVEQDRAVRMLTDQPNPPSYGIDRIDQRDLPLNQKYSYSTGASNVTAYVIDTGINYSHQDFGGRATFGFDAFNDGQQGKDCQGHGTHVAGTVGGKTFGVAKEVKLKAVRVLNCQGGGSISTETAGVDWVTANAVLPAVGNMSLYTGTKNEPSRTLDDAVARSIQKGITYVVAAGNFNDNSCAYSPQRVRETINVMASTSTDARASFSSYGECSDLYAPGLDIVSAAHSSNTGNAKMSGTSMASPHVAGAAALYLAANPSAVPATVHKAIVDSATPGKISNPGTGSANKLLFTGTGGGTPEPSTCAKVANEGDVFIPDTGVNVSSAITFGADCTGNGTTTAAVEVSITHTYRGDLVIDLLAPDGTAYRLKNSSGTDSADNVNTTYAVNLSSEVLKGTWKLQVRDIYRGDVGTINRWALTP
ncbi:MAG: S8 family peptidase [Actinomycetota bacterium]|nr:S8 family peptidase [Actinomycetota bacterium]